MKLKTKRLLSALVAVVVAFSLFATTMTAFAAYKPEYTEKVSEEDYELLIGDLNTILDDFVFTGDIVQEIYKILPSLKMLLNHGGSAASDKAAFYKEHPVDAVKALFAELPDGDIVADVVDAETGEVTTEGTFTKYFADHPILCNDAADFKAQLDTVIDAVVIENIMNTLQLLPLMMGNDMLVPAEFAGGIDDICKALGIAQEKSAADVLGFNLMTTGAPADKDSTVQYLKNIVAALFPDTANKAIDLVQRALVDENAVLIYRGVHRIVDNLSKMVAGLGSSGLPIDVSAIQAQVDEIKAVVDAIPATGEGEARKFDIQGAVGYLVSKLTNNAVGIKFGDKTTVGTVILNFTEMDLTRVIEAESNADVIKIVFDYLYNNIIGNKDTNRLISFGLSSGIIENALGVTLAPEFKDTITAALAMSNEELSNELIVAVANIAGRELPPDPDPVPPTTDPEEEPTDKPSKPGTPSDDSDKKPSTNNEPIKTPSNVKNPSLPNTGTEDGVTTSVAAEVIIAVGVAALAAIIISVKKRATAK